MENKIFCNFQFTNSEIVNEIIKSVEVEYCKYENLNSDLQIFNSKIECNIHFYIIEKSFYEINILKLIIDSLKFKNKIVIVHIVPDGFNFFQLNEFIFLRETVIGNGGICFIDSDINRSKIILNSSFK